MSIWASTLAFDDEEHSASCARMVPDDQAPPVRDGEIAIGYLMDEGSFRLVDGECTCGGWRRAPILYQGSHVTPTIEDPRGGSIDLATIPPHISPRGIAHDEEQATRWDFLRFGFVLPAEKSTVEGMYVAECLLDRDQITELRDELTKWLDRGIDW